MKIVSTGNTFRVYDDTLKTYSKLPAGTYNVCFSKMSGFFLEAKTDLAITEKIYGVHMSKVKKIMKSFEQFERNLGVILSGNKGIGKSVTAKLLAIESVKKGLPVIFVNQYIPGIADFLSSIEQKCTVLFDEFDKTFRMNPRDNEGGGAQDEMLTLFDGLDQGKKLFVVTCNELRNLSDFLVNRPGRFHYHLRFDYPSVDEIREYLTDKVEEDYKDQIEEVVKFSGLTDLNYDCLRAIAFELNMGTPFKDAIKDLNITNYDNDYRYDITCVLENGMKSIKKNYGINLDRDYAEICFDFPALKDRVYMEFDPSMHKYNTVTYEDEIGEDAFSDVSWSIGISSNVIPDSGNYDDEPIECEEDCSEETINKQPRQVNPRVVKVIFKRKSSYSNIHYMVD